MIKLEFSRRFQLVLSVSAFTVLFLVGAVYSQLQSKPDYPNVFSTTSDNTFPTIGVDDDNEIPHTLVGGYYSVRNGLKSELLLNNKGGNPIEIKPTLYGVHGEIMEIAPIIVEPSSHRFVDIKEWADLGGAAFQEGNIRLFHRGKDLVIGSQIHLTDESKSLGFEYKLQELSKFDSRRLEAVWWNPSNQSDVNVVLTNTSDELLNVNAKLTRKPAISNDPQTFILQPHETKVLNIRRDFDRGNPFSRKDVLALSLWHGGKADALLAWTMIRDENSGYSNVATFTNPRTVESKQYHGAGLQLGEIGNDKLKPVVVVRNTSNREVNATVKVPYTRTDGSKSVVDLGTFALAPREVREVDMREVGQLENVKVAGIEIKYDGGKGSLIASTQSVSKSKNQVFRVLMWDVLAHRSATGGYPFYIQGTSSSKAYIKNATDRDQDYYAYLVYGNYQFYVVNSGVIAPNETVEIDVKKLRDEQTPDVWGAILPTDLTQGQIQWSGRPRKENEGAAIPDNLGLIGQMEQFDTVKGINSTYFCENCCTGRTGGASISPTSRTVEFGEVSEVNYRLAQVQQICYPTPAYVLIPISADSWTLSNPGIGSINSSGTVTIQGAGQTNIRATYETNNIYVEPCSPNPVRPSPLDGDENENCETDGFSDESSVSVADTSLGESDSTPPVVLRPRCGTCINMFGTGYKDASLTVKPKIIIKRDGQPVTASNNTTIVGERLNLTAEIMPSSSSSTDRNWTIPNTAIKDFVVSPGNATGSVTAVDGLNTPSVNFVWIDGGGANVEDITTKEVLYQAVINGETLEARASFNVKRPKFVLKTTTQTTNIIANNNGEESLIFGNSSVNGIRFYNDAPPMIPPANPGTTAWVQIVNSSSRTVTFPNPYPPITDNDSGLDGCFPYVNFGSGQAFDSPVQQISIINPANNTLLRSISGNVNDNFTMWLMFKPNSTGASWVPLKNVNWVWVASYQLTAGGQYTVVDNSSQNPAFQDTLSFPTWGNVVPSIDPCP